MATPTPTPTAVLAPETLETLVGALRARGYRVVGPTVRDGAVVLDELESAGELPIGWVDRQEAGEYRLERRSDDARFGFSVGPHSPKQLLFPPHVRLWRARRADGEAPVVEEEEVDERPLALVGARACELRAIAVQDRVFLGGRYADRDYAQRREGLLVVAVDCHEPGGTCFCDSMGTGPAADGGFDLRLTELLEGEHRLLARAGSEVGAELLGELPSRPATAEDEAAAERSLERAAAKMGRQLDPDGLRDPLARNLEHPRWDDVASRCLSCTNCTLVCPTCFCSSVEDANDLADGSAERHRVWDSCFTLDHSYIHGGSVRATGRSRYRQWLTHKLGTWHDQFGTSGCVGCGRCITWCPVGIDLTEEVAAIRATEDRHAATA